MLPIRRDLHFTLPAKHIKNWHDQGPYVSHYFNTLSLLFPQIELFFMDSVRHYRNRIGDPELRKKVQAFIGQEAMHSREHLVYNRLLQSAGLPTRALDRRFKTILDFQRKYLPASFNLAVTIAMEHYTATLAEVFLSDLSRHGNTVKEYQLMWSWHALEEIEHKSVVFDVWNTVIKPGPLRYLLRAGAMLFATISFWPLVFGFHIRLLIADRRAGGHRKGMWRMIKYLYGLRGVFPCMALPWLDYFRPGFHPWDHNNQARLDKIDVLIEEIERTNNRYVMNNRTTASGLYEKHWDKDQGR